MNQPGLFDPPTVAAEALASLRATVAGLTRAIKVYEADLDAINEAAEALAAAIGDDHNSDTVEIIKDATQRLLPPIGDMEQK
jgi:hypothetical protein